MAVMNVVAEDLEIVMIVVEIVMAVEVLVASIAILAVEEIVVDVLNEEMTVIVHHRREVLAWIVKENRIVQMKIWSVCL
jgi:hypothetical protein